MPWKIFSLNVSLEYISAQYKRWGFPGGSDSKESACNVGDLGSTRVRKIPWRREWLPTPVSWAGELHGQRNLVGYSPWGRQEQDTTE